MFCYECFTNTHSHLYLRICKKYSSFNIWKLCIIAFVFIQNKKQIKFEYFVGISDSAATAFVHRWLIERFINFQKLYMHSFT